MAAPPPNIRHNKDSEVSSSRTNQMIYLWTSWEISNNQEYIRLYYDGGDPMSFKDFIDSMGSLANGIDDGKY